MLGKQVCDILALAQKMLSKRGGWRQGDYGPVDDMDAAHCSVGAIICAAEELGYQGWSGMETGYAIRALADELPYDGDPEGAVIAWNDLPRRRKKDVLALFTNAQVKGGC